MGKVSKSGKAPKANKASSKSRRGLALTSGNATDATRSALQAYVTTYHLPHLRALVGALVAVKRLVAAMHASQGGEEEFDEEKLSELKAMLKELTEMDVGGLPEGSSFEDLKTKLWNPVLTARQKQTFSTSAGKGGDFAGSVVGTDFFTQIDDEIAHMGTDAEFDDSKLYKQLLADFVKESAASAGESGPSGAISSTQKTKNAGVDRKASKGRKLRYVIHEKLVNFCFPQEREVTSTIDEDSWFKSMLR